MFPTWKLSNVSSIKSVKVFVELDFSRENLLYLRLVVVSYMLWTLIKTLIVTIKMKIPKIMVIKPPSTDENSFSFL